MAISTQTCQSVCVSARARVCVCVCVCASNVKVCKLGQSGKPHNHITFQNQRNIIIPQPLYSMESTETHENIYETFYHEHDMHNTTQTWYNAQK